MYTYTPNIEVGEVCRGKVYADFQKHFTSWAFPPLIVASQWIVPWKIMEQINILCSVWRRDDVMAVGCFKFLFWQEILHPFQTPLCNYNFVKLKSYLCQWNLSLNVWYYARLKIPEIQVTWPNYLFY